MNEKIKEWLLARNISEKVISESNVKWNGMKIVIPVYDINGKLLFNKYRRNPYTQNSDEPKYTYDRGATGALFNIQKPLVPGPIFITEGETDALVLNSFGLNAVSSTGGSGTFKEDWAEWLNSKENHSIYICYDRDMAGIKGSLRVQQMLPRAKVVFLPFTLKGKDVTDFFLQYKMVDFVRLVNDSESWVLPSDIEEIPKKKKDIDVIIKNLKQELEDLTEKRNDYNNKGKCVDHFDVLRDILEKRLESWKSLRNYKGPLTEDKELKDDVYKAKSFPITQLLKFDGNGFAKCIFHDRDDTPSLKYYKKDNRVHCFACQAHEDVISVYQKLNNVSFKEAVKNLSK